MPDPPTKMHSMGRMFREYWMPAARSSELKEDGDPVRLGLFGDIGFTSPAISEKGYYNVAMDLPAAGKGQAFTAPAPGAGVQARDACGALTIDNAGVKTPGPDDAGNSNGSCW